MGGWQVGIDVGGTFTDVVAFRPLGGEVAQAKVPSRRDDPVAALVDALAAVGVDWGDVDDLVHGTTMVTNAVVEGRLAKVALVATEGFADTLAIGRQNRRYLYRLDPPPKLAPQVPESLRFEVGGRLDHRGGELAALDEAVLDALAERISASGAEAIAVALLHAYASPDHERRVGERLARLTPHLALSHEVSPEAREYERTATTALSAGVMPLAAGYLDRLDARRPESSRLHLFHSAGGMASPRALRGAPLGLALSGPAAGVAAAAWVAAELGIEHAISFDMGGTTTDVCLIANARAEVSSNRTLADRPLRMPMVAVESIGAGGGSIARFDTGVLTVGPDSAGADPGPACYGRGGELPTVSDADLVLGYLDTARELGSIRLVPENATAALAPLAAASSATIPETALGVTRVANAAMARALRRVTVERGIDGRRCTLIAFGGAGPMHAVELARSFGIEQVVVPACSSGFSALGCVTAEMSYTRQRTIAMASTTWDADRLAALRAELAADVRAPLAASGHADPGVGEVAAVRYGGQSYAVEIEHPSLDSPQHLGTEFRERHQALYGFATDEPWELVSLRVTASAPRGSRPELALPPCAGAPQPTATGECWFAASGAVPTPRFDRASLGAGARIAGPAIVEDRWSTVVLPPGAVLEVDAGGHLHITVGAMP